MSKFVLRLIFVQMTCALASLRFSSQRGRNHQKCKTTNENQIQITFNCVSLLVCFHAFFDVFSLCCVFMCLFDMCSCVAFFSVIFMCVQFLFATSICADDMCSRLFALSSQRGRNPQCKKTNENARQITFNCVSFLVCFHAFLMCFPFVVCSCVFSICVRL